MVSNTDLPNFILNCVLAAITLYLLVAFAFYEYSTTYWNNRIGSNSEVHNKLARILRILCIIGVGFGLMHHVVEIVSPFVTNDTACKSVGAMWLLTYSLAILTVYVFLWQRQRWLYESPALKHLRTGCVKAFSWIVLIFLVVSAVMIFLAGSRLISFSTCSETHPSIMLYNTILSATLLTLTILGQTQLLILFLIPLLSHARYTKDTFGNKQKSPEPSSVGDTVANSNDAPPRRSATRKENGSAGMMNLVRRCFILAVINMTSDITAALLTILLENIAAGKLVYDTNILISVMCCVGSFQSWTCMILPWRRTRGEQRRRERINTISIKYGNGMKISDRNNSKEAEKKVETVGTVVQQGYTIQPENKESDAA